MCLSRNGSELFTEDLHQDSALSQNSCEIAFGRLAAWAGTIVAPACFNLLVYTAHLCVCVCLVPRNVYKRTREGYLLDAIGVHGVPIPSLMSAVAAETDYE